jgi:hypothetical protein
MSPDHAAVPIEAEQLRNVDVVEAGFLTYEHVGAPADIVYSRVRPPPPS